MICVAATYLIREGHEDAAMAGILEAQALSRQEPGCVFYQAHRSVSEPRRFFLYEQWADEDAFKAHSRTDHFKAIILKRVVPLIEDRQSATYERID